MLRGFWETEAFPLLWHSSWSQHLCCTSVTALVCLCVTCPSPSLPTAILRQLRSGGHQRVHGMPQSQLLLHILPAEGIGLLVTRDSVPWGCYVTLGSARQLRLSPDGCQHRGRNGQQSWAVRAEPCVGQAFQTHPASEITSKAVVMGQVCKSGQG